MFQLSPKSEAPEIFLDVKLLAGLTVKAGTKIELPAKITGKPEPRITWTKAEKILRPDDRITIETKPGHSTVTITDSKRSDSGTYIIEAVNSSGRATAVVEVNVLGMHIFFFIIKSMSNVLRYASRRLTFSSYLLQINLVHQLHLMYQKSLMNPAF